MPCEELKKDCTNASDATQCSQQKGLSPIGLALLVDVRKRGLNVNLKPKKSNSSNNSIDISLSDLESSTDTYLSSTPTYTPITLHTNDRLNPTERVNSTELIEEDEEEDDTEISHPQPQSEDEASPHVWLSSLPFARRNRLQDLRYRSMSLARTTSGLCHRSNELDPTTSSNALVRSYSNTSDR
ncbi:hypothetical protein SARC_03109 [Sphaeroforma arctica JP610]|uniref:Uncharacterized protein n=1 Tax=Sphaeroforma arctica JP610 TaxID=667725 RepID=A0A0L0G6N2_9EUKA|nr:hypothetical protein SARC_03109 [Sphaeroforma arctica JP610]KNC84675.1 hypothetical protein SARC_03109 [Sphaeroforma arctica JP610]|eukprot:XP_014158577.1 hypothetical protein SARC_03109 [Sphaeroforma arctica JP610]